MEKRNYQKELERVLECLPQKKPPHLLLHACCAPCSSYVLEYLSGYFEITVFYYNPNIGEEAEYRKRVGELQSLLARQPYQNPVHFLEGKYEPERFEEIAKGLEQEPERGKRCYACYRLRLEEAARVARELNADYFTTTLSISPMKNADWLNEIGEQLAGQFGQHYLPSDFKKRNGYKRSVALSKEYGLYRQDYCGCIYSRRKK